MVFLTINYPDLMDIEKQIKITKGLNIEKQQEIRKTISDKIEVPERLARAIERHGNSSMGLEVINKIKSGEVNITNLFTKMLYYRAISLQQNSNNKDYLFTIKDVTEILKLILTPEIRVEGEEVKVVFPGIVRERVTQNGRHPIQHVSLDIRNKNPMGDLIQSFEISVGQDKITQIISFHNFNIDGIFLLTEGKSADMYNDFNIWLNSLKQHFLEEFGEKISRVSQQGFTEKPNKLGLLDKLSSAKKQRYQEELLNHMRSYETWQYNMWVKDDVKYVVDELFRHRTDTNKLGLLLLMAERSLDASLGFVFQKNGYGEMTEKMNLSLSTDY